MGRGQRGTGRTEAQPSRKDVSGGTAHKRRELKKDVSQSRIERLPSKLSLAQIRERLAPLGPQLLNAAVKIFGGPRLSRLLTEFNLSPEQVGRLCHALRRVEQDLTHSASPEKVRAQVQELADHLDRADKLVRRWKRERRPEPGPEALGALQSAHIGWVPSEQASEDGTVPELVRGDATIELAAELAQRALKLLPPRHTRRTASGARADQAAWLPASASAIDWIVKALNDPQDERSRAAALSLPVRRSRASRGSFQQLATLVFAAALGRTEEQVNATNSINAYRERLSARATAAD